MSKVQEFIHCNKCESSLILKNKQHVIKLMGAPVMYFEEDIFCPKCRKWRNKSTSHYSYSPTCKQNKTEEKTL